jgi:ubiquinol-cytochrome c reductase cytochrome b subunit/menaquinol-cytochrome c reductase cytochrome b/c subunit
MVLSDQRSTSTPEPEVRMSDQRRAFLEYKKRVAESGKPFFPYGVWHDVIAAAGVLALLVVLSVMWFGMANCDSPWNVSCNRVSTPLEQEQYTPDEPGVVKRTKSGKIDTEVPKPLLGLLYEAKADPATTSYHPRPEWYFYFLFYLLVLASNPQLVVFGTIIIPTIWLVMLLAVPLVDRRKERRPSRRPLAMAALVLTAIMLLSLTYLGSQAGAEGGGPEGLTDEQMAMPGYDVLFGDTAAFETCGACHQLGGVGNGGPGPSLDKTGTNYDSADELVEVMANGLGGGAMPVKGGTAITDEEGAQVAAFLKTMGAPGEAASLTDFGLDDWNRVTGAATGGAGEDSSSAENTSDLKDTGEAAGDEDADKK